MNYPAHPTVRPRTLATLLADLREARRDYDDALADGRNAADGLAAEEADNRATEAETRREDMLAEFDVRLAEVTGLSVEDIRGAFADAVI